jgi:hypothetical protein
VPAFPLETLPIPWYLPVALIVPPEILMAIEVPPIAVDLLASVLAAVTAPPLMLILPLLPPIP